jgi:lipopolysaccharide transport system ATP-binding protein
VGTGFHPELTGRENIYLNGAILGMKRREITKQFDAIVEFSGVERFLEVPVKRYSSGMTVRLAFAVAAHLEPEVLVVDEVLAVGDAEFQSRCLGKMGDVARMDQRTVLFVSHNMAAVETLCTRCIHLEHGKVAFDGATPDAISHYLSTRAGTVSTLPGEFEIVPDKVGARTILKRVRLLSSDGPTETFRLGGDMSIAILAEGLDEFPHSVVGMTIRSELDDRLVVLHTDMKPSRGTARRAAVEEVVFDLEGLPLTPGTYWLDVGVWDHDRRENIQLGHRSASFSVVGTDVHGSGHSRWEGVAFVRFDWQRRPHAPASVEPVSARRDYKPAPAS